MREDRQEGNRDENGGRGGRCERGGHQGQGSKKSSLVEDVLEYWEVYQGDGAN